MRLIADDPALRGHVPESELTREPQALGGGRHDRRTRVVGGIGELRLRPVRTTDPRQ